MNWSETCMGNISTKIYVVYGHYIYYNRVQQQLLTTPAITATFLFLFSTLELPKFLLNILFANIKTTAKNIS